MALGGDLSKIDLTAIFQTLALNQQVGTLVVTENDSGRKTSLYFDQNSVALVASDKRNYFRIGQILINRGIISEEVLRRALEQQKRAGGLLGEVLCDLGVVTAEEIEEVVRSQIEEEIFELFQWRHARFEFLEGAPPTKSALDGYITSLNFDPNSLLMEAARRLDEWDVMKEFIPTLQEILIIDEEAWDDEEFEDLTIADRSIIDLLDGERDIQDLAQDTSLPRFQICKTLYDWLRAGKIRSLTSSELEALAADCEQANNIPLAIKFYLRSFSGNDLSEHMSERLAHCHEMIGESRKAAEFYSHLGDLRWDSGKVTEAVDAYGRACKLNPGQTIALERLFEHAANENDLPSVLSTGKSLLKSYMRELQVAEAADLCRGLLERFPDDLDLRKQMINIHLDRRDAKAAAKEYEEILELLKRRKAWSEMADVCSKIVQLDPERDEYRPLIETYRARGERSFKKLIRKPIVILPTASFLGLLVILVISYNVLAGQAYSNAREALNGGNEESALKQYQDIVRKYPWSTVADDAANAAAEIEKRIDAQRREIEEMSTRIVGNLEAGREAMKAGALKEADKQFRQVADERSNPALRRSQVMKGIGPWLDEADAALEELAEIRAGLESKLEDARARIAERDLDAAAVLIDEILRYGLWDDLAAEVERARNQIRRLGTERAGLELHRLYVEAREAEKQGDRTGALKLYRQCLTSEVRNLEYDDAMGFLAVQQQVLGEVADRLARIEQSRRRADWKDMNGKIMELMGDYPELGDDPEVASRVRYRVSVTNAPAGAKLTVVGAGLDGPIESVVGEDGVVVLDLPPFVPGNLQIVVLAPGFSTAPHRITRDVLSDAAATLSVERVPAWIGPAVEAGAVEGGVTVDDQEVYVPSRDGNLYVLDLSSGNLNRTWEGDGQELVAPVTVVAGVAYVGKLNGKKFVGIQGEAEKFAVAISGYVKGQAASAGNVIVFGSSNSKVHAIDARGGQVWERPVDGAVEADVVTDGSSFYVATRAGTVYSFSAKGDQNWSRNFGHSVVGRMAVDDERLYVGSTRGTMMAFWTSDGSDAWPGITSIKDVEVRGGCAKIGDYVIVGAEKDGSGRILLVQAATGAVVRSLVCKREPVRSRPLVIGNRAYVGTTYLKNGVPAGGRLFALELRGDQLATRWDWVSDDHPIEGSIASGVATDGSLHIVIGSLSGKVVAFRD